MAFNLSNFNEINLLGNPSDKLRSALTSTANAGLDRLKQAQNKMATIASTAVGVNRWFGYTAAEYQQRHSELYDLGQIISANFFVDFEPYEGNNTRYLPMFADRLSGFLVSETSLSALNAEYESTKIGTFYSNHITGFNEPDVQMSLIETAEARFLNSIQQWRELMVNDDGTMNPPASYAVRMTTGIFSKDGGLQSKPYSKTLIVAPTIATLDALTGAAVSEVLSVPVTFTVLRNFME